MYNQLQAIRFILIILALLSGSHIARSQNPDWNAAEIQLALKKLNTLGSALYIAAHPDDENTRLLAYLANERLLHTTYLSLTRGDGGQNLVGKEQAAHLGIIRTQELLAARRIDGAGQAFTRANDFGYSKSADETLKKWGKEEVLSDIVWQIRKLQPDIIITRFPSTGEGGHGHHTASAILAKEAFYAAADPARFPEQLQYLKTWQAKSLFWNTFNLGSNNTTSEEQLKIDVGLYNTLLGKSYGELAAESRSMHKSQGFGSAKLRGSKLEYFKLVAGDTKDKDLLQGIDMSWNRVKGGAEIMPLVNKLIKEYQAEYPEKSIPGLLQVYRLLNKAGDNYWATTKKEETIQLLLACSGSHLEVIADDYSVVPGRELKITAQIIRRKQIPITLQSIQWDAANTINPNSSLNYNELLKIEHTLHIPANAPYSTAYWLNEPHSEGLYTVKEQLMRGIPESTPALPVNFMLKIQDELIPVSRAVVYKWADPVEGEKYREIEISPPVTVNSKDAVYIFANQQPKNIKIIVHAYEENVNGDLFFALPGGWRSEPASIPVKLQKKGDEQVFNFTVYPKNTAAYMQEKLRVTFKTGTDTFNKSIYRIEHKHIPMQTGFTESETKLVVLPLEKRGVNIGYIPGAGDEVPACLEQIGYNISILTEEQLLNDKLGKFDAIITGIRAYNTNEKMNVYQPFLMDYVKQGGTLIVQYNTNNFIGSVTENIGPYPFKISRDRVTDEQAIMQFEDPSNILLSYPNKISSKDFEGWVQERGLYFASDFDARYKAVFSCKDPEDEYKKGSLIVANYGKGYYIYTGLAFFRELPAGVPGAYRLFSNMLSIGQLR